MTQSLNICPLDYQSIFEIIGDDSEKFLQGQLSCDLKEVIEEGSRLAAHCTPKGSMLSLMRVILLKEDHFIVKTNTPIFQEAIANLNKYIMFSKADIKDTSKEWAGFGIFGDKAADFINREFKSIPCDIDHTITTENTIIIKTAHQRYEIWLKAIDANSWLNNLDIEEYLQPSSLWLMHDIKDAIPDIFPQTSGLYIPQMCNLQALKGVSFKKGCYTGQEVITRLHFRGKLTKYLITAVIKNNVIKDTELFNTEIYCDQKKVGQVLQSITIKDITYLQIIVNQKYAKEPLLLNEVLLTIPLNQPYELDPSLFVRKD